jgi:2-polyprenyl-6-hydroxyphenyl methylase / 3-demethylubiquinone-9 3-methyltransferase
VCSSEVIEHVEDYERFLKCLAKLVSKDGDLFVSTINRTPKSYLLAILGAEYIAGIVPPGEFG